LPKGAEPENLFSRRKKNRENKRGHSQGAKGLVSSQAKREILPQHTRSPPVLDRSFDSFGARQQGGLQSELTDILNHSKLGLIET